MQYGPEAKTAVERFHQAGYQVWMDDFGSGYSSLNVLKGTDFDEIKLDMGFLSEFSEKSRELITTVVRAGRGRRDRSPSRVLEVDRVREAAGLLLLQAAEPR